MRRSYLIENPKLAGHENGDILLFPAPLRGICVWLGVRPSFPP